MNAGVLIELRIEHEYRERFLYATRLYALHTRNEPTKPRVEVLELDGSVDFSIRELYPNEAAIEAHARTEHARMWLEAIPTFGAPDVAARRFSFVLNEPALPTAAPKPPALETATNLPNTRSEAILWGKTVFAHEVPFLCSRRPVRSLRTRSSVSACDLVPRFGRTAPSHAKVVSAREPAARRANPPFAPTRERDFAHEDISLRKIGERSGEASAAIRWPMHGGGLRRYASALDQFPE